MAESSAEALARRLYTALEIGDAAAVRRALADGADPERGPAEEFGTRPLMQLLVNMEIANQMNKHPDAPDWEKRYHKPGADPVACCAALLEAGASPNRSSRTVPGHPDLPADSMAPIFRAVAASPAVLELLIGAGADVNVVFFIDHHHYETALHIASRLGLVQQAAALLAAGADVNAEIQWCGSLSPRTPLDQAIRHEPGARVCSLLLRAGATFPQSPAFYLGAAIGATCRVRNSRGRGTFNLAYVQKIQKAGGIRPYEALVKKSLTAMLEPKLPQIPKEIIPTIVEFWAHAGDYCMPFCMPFGPETLVRRGLEQIAARVANGNVVVASHK